MNNLKSLPQQPSPTVQRQVQQVQIQKFFAQFLKQSLLPYSQLCSQCNVTKQESITLEEPLPKVLLIRMMWSEKCLRDEKNDSFIGIPNTVDFSDICTGGSGKTYYMKSMLVQSPYYGQSVVLWNNCMKCFILYGLKHSVKVDTLDEIMDYCAYLCFQPLLLLYDDEKPNK